MEERYCFEKQGKKAVLFAASQEDRPLIVLNSFESDGSSVLDILREDGCGELNLLTVDGIDWNRDMSPWQCPAVFKGEADFSGGAKDYLKDLTTQILPEALKRIKGTPAFTGIAGYSLAGLFALYALYECDSFTRAASMSGSLWFPDFKEFAMTNAMKRQPEKMYFSVGDREAKTRNPIMKTVQENTEALAAFYAKAGIDVTFELNPGNHFQDADNRIAKGIFALMQNN